MINLKLILHQNDKFAVLVALPYMANRFHNVLKSLLSSIMVGQELEVIRKCITFMVKVRFFIFDSGFKEGIDLLDVKYVHLFDTPLNDADRKQAVGRANRTCGQMILNLYKSGMALHICV